MASYGSAVIQPLPEVKAIVIDSYVPVGVIGGGGEAFIPKRYLNVGGTAVAIQ